MFELTEYTLVRPIGKGPFKSQPKPNRLEKRQKNMVLNKRAGLHSDNNSILARGAAGAFIIKIASVLAAFGMQLLLARLLKLEQFGIYVYAITWVNFGILIGKLGLDTASVKYIAAYRAKEEWAELIGFLRTSRMAVAIASVGLCLLGCLAVFFTQKQISSDLHNTFWLTLCFLPLLAYATLLSSQLRAFKRIVASQSTIEVLRPLLVIGILILAPYLFSEQVNASAAILAHIIAAIVVIAVLHLFLMAETQSAWNEYTPRYRHKEWASAAMPMLLISGFNLIISQAGILIVGSVCTPADAGLYAPAQRIGGMITIILTSVNTIAAPMISELYTRGQQRQLQSLVTQAAKWVFLTTFPVCIVLVLFGDFILGIYGPEFVGGYPALRIIAVTQLVNALAGSVGYLMIMTGHQNTAVKILAISAFLNIGLNFALIPGFGIVGAAMANGIATVVWNLLMYRFTIKLVRIDPTIFSLRASLAAS